MSEQAKTLEGSEPPSKPPAGWRLVRGALALSVCAFLLSAGELAWDRWEKKLDEEAARRAWAAEFDRGWHERFDRRRDELVAGFHKLGYETTEMERECYGEMDLEKSERCITATKKLMRELERENAGEVQ